MIDSQLQLELRKKFNPDDSLLRKHQLRMLEMLKYFDTLCQAHGITYWLSSGTLIGAVRHGGFIPWDDDVDVEMLRGDYEKLVKVFEAMPNPEFVLQTHQTDYYYFAPYAKLRDRNSVIKEVNTKVDLYYKYRGVFIDVFIMEPSSTRRLARYIAILHNRLLLHPMSYLKNRFIRAIYYRLAFGFVRGLIIPVLKPFTQIGARDRLRHTLGVGFTKERYRSEIFPVQKIPFEDTCLPVPQQYDRYLRRIYGDYTKLPPIDDIEIHTTEVTLQ